MLNLLIFESITANIKNIKNLPELLSKTEFSSMKSQGENMIAALHSDLRQTKGLNIIVGKQRVGETASDFMNRISPRIDLAWVIAPENDGELEDCCLALKKKIWIGSELCAIRLASNKLKTKNYLKSIGINTPDEISSESIKKISYTKAVYKPIDGAGAIDTCIIEGEEKILNKIDYTSSNFLLEEWIEGEPFSVSLNCKPDDFEILSINQQHITVDSFGKLTYRGVSPVNKRMFNVLYENIEPILYLLIPTIPGLRGFVGIDFILGTNSRISIIEINPRLTCSYIGLSNHANCNIALKILNSFGVKK